MTSPIHDVVTITDHTTKVLDSNNKRLYVVVGTDVSDIVQFRIIRDNANASGLFSGSDPLNAIVKIMSYDVHIITNSQGSRTEFAK